MQLENNGKINFIIAEHHQFSAKLPRGGHIVLHLLANKLAQRGHNAYIFADPMYPHPNIRVIPQDYWLDPDPDSNIAKWSYEPFVYPLDQTISIFPSNYLGNPFNTIHNVRLVMDHVEEENLSSWDDNDYVAIGGWTTWNVGKKVDFRLPVFDCKLDLFQDRKNPRAGYCHALWKYTPDNHKEILEPFQSTDITQWPKLGGFEYLANALNQHEYFLTFDRKTFLTTAAVLCGCKAIIIDPNKNPFPEKIQTPGEFRTENPLNYFGVAFGMEDLAWAEDSLHLARKNVENLTAAAEKFIDEFVLYWEKKLNIS